MQVRLAAIDDVDALVATNAQAFENDPLVAWLFPTSAAGYARCSATTRRTSGT
jgi:hypothetical protein